METTLHSEGAASTRERYSPRAADSSKRIPQLDGLRGLAILQVVLLHYITASNHGPSGTPLAYLTKIFGLGWSGVDLFFVLSGFLIGGILLDARESPRYFQTFYLRRVHRIFPIYYLWVGVYSLLLFGLLVSGTRIWDVQWADFRKIPIYIFYLQNFFYEQRLLQWVWLSVTWSLAIEEQFYLLCPPLIRFVSRRRLVMILVSAVVLAPVLRGFVFNWGASGPYAAAFLMPCRADALALGVLAAIGWREPAVRAFLARNTVLLYRFLLFFFCGILAMLWSFLHPLSRVSATIGLSCIDLFYCVLILVVLTDQESVLAGITRWKFLRDLGTISYCVYIIHDTINHLAHRALLHGSPRIYDSRGVGVTLLSMGLTFGIAKLSWACFEKPLVQRGHAYQY